VCVVVVLWAVTGPFFGYSDTWQLVINTGTTIVTFLVVFLIQATQNRDSKVIHLKLDELLRAISKARTGLVGLEDMDEEDVKRIEADFAAIKARQARRLQEKSQHVNGNGSPLHP
jgi:low affinity Fe/Cu permease